MESAFKSEDTKSIEEISMKVLQFKEHIEQKFVVFRIVSSHYFEKDLYNHKLKYSMIHSYGERRDIAIK
jgi:KaiC/GvpD/RAD55 family RecA-like ATPase